MTSQPELSPSARVIGIMTLLDEAQALLADEPLRELILATRRAVDDAHRGRFPVGTDAWIAAIRPGISESARAYLRPIELLLHAAGHVSPILNRGQIERIDAYLDEVAGRPVRSRLPAWQSQSVPAVTASSLRWSADGATQGL